MIIYNISTQDIVKSKVDQMRYIGLSPLEYKMISDVVESAVVRRHIEEKGQLRNL